MSDEEDTRILCKYGADCYQKKSEHRNKYKHPGKRMRSPEKRSPKRQKMLSPQKRKVRTPKKNPDKNKATVSSHDDISDEEFDNKHPKQRTKTSPKKPKECTSSDYDISDAEFDDEKCLKQCKKSTKKDRKAKSSDYEISDEDSDDNKKQTKKSPNKIKVQVVSHNDVSDDEMSDCRQESSSKFTKRLNVSPKSSNVIDDTIRDDQLLDAIETAEVENEILEKKKSIIKQFFLVDMPEDFYQFWEFCKSISEKDPRKVFDSIGLTLVGPFDVLASRNVSQLTKGEHLLHWRYYFDPPEFQTVIRGDDKTEYHIGYFRDTPEQPPVFLGENCAAKDCIIKPIGTNIFAAVHTYFDNFVAKANPFKRMELLQFQRKVRDRARSLHLDLSSKLSSKRKPVCKSFHTSGIVVPLDKKTDVGYRPLSVTDKQLKNICNCVATAPEESISKSMSALQPVVTAATIAIDECDFGTGLELGINLFCYGNKLLDNMSLRMLTSAYSVLDRRAFIEIAKAHLKNREKGMPLVVKY